MIEATTSSSLDLDVDAGRERVEALERVDRLRCGLVDVDQPLVGADLEVLAGVLVLERGPDHAVDVLVRGQRHGAGDAGAGALRRLDDLAGSAIDGVVVVRLETDSDLVCGDGSHFFFQLLPGADAPLSRRRGTAPCSWGAAPGFMSLQRPPFSGRIKGRPRGRPSWSLLENLGDDPRAYGTAALSDGEPKALVHGDRVDELDRHLDVVSRHHHLGALREVRNPRDVGRPEVELRPVSGEERRVASALLLLEAIDLGLEL